MSVSVSLEMPRAGGSVRPIRHAADLDAFGGETDTPSYGGRK